MSSFVNKDGEIFVVIISTALSSDRLGNNFKAPMEK